MIDAFAVVLDCTNLRRCQVFVDADNRTTTDERRRREKMRVEFGVTRRRRERVAKSLMEEKQKGPEGKQTAGGWLGGEQAIEALAHHPSGLLVSPSSGNEERLLLPTRSIDYDETSPRLKLAGGLIFKTQPPRQY